MSFARIVVTAGLTSLTLGVIARGWSRVRHGPAWTAPPPDCPPKGAHVAGLAVVRKQLGSARGAPVLVAVHGFGETPALALERLAGLSASALAVAPRAPMPLGEGAAWTWAQPDDPSFAIAMVSAATNLVSFLREVRRCHPGRRLVATGHGQGAQVLLTAAALEPSVADALVLAGAGLPTGLVPAALPRTVLQGSPELAAELAALGLPVTSTPDLSPALTHALAPSKEPTS